MSQDDGWIIMAVGLVLCVLEIWIPSFVAFPIGVGAIFSGIVCYFGAPTSWVLLTWSITSFIFWLSIRNLYKKMTPEEYKTGIEALVGKDGKVIETIEKDKGRIKIFGDEWEVINESGDNIPIGEKVKVVGFEGNKLKIVLNK